MLDVDFSAPLIPAVAGINANLCTKWGGRVVPKLTDSGDVKYWCVGGKFDGQPVINEID